MLIRRSWNAREAKLIIRRISMSSPFWLLEIWMYNLHQMNALRLGIQLSERPSI